MTPTQVTITKYLAIILLCFGAGFYLRDVQADRDVNKTKLEAMTAQVDAHKQFEAKIEQRDATNQKLNNAYQALQLTASQALNDKLAENSRLAADLGVARGMSLRGSRCVDPAAVRSPAAAGVAADDGAMLSAETRRFVFDLRAAIETERALKDGWRDYAAYLDAQIREHQRLHGEVKRE